MAVVEDCIFENEEDVAVMSRNRPMGQIVLLMLAVVAIGIAIYLTIVHYDEHVPLVCSTKGFVDCAAVLSSGYSVVPGTSVPITIPGLAWGVVSAALAIMALRLSSLSPFSATLRNVHIAQFVWSLVGLLTALYLVYAEIVRLHTICAWCTALHVIILVMFLITLVQLQQGTDVEEEESEAELELIVSSKNHPLAGGLSGLTGIRTRLVEPSPRGWLVQTH